ncbi:unnamed protein product (macronuclear) [Paramecium tetraurelia]|uniref:Armadillo-type fold n=1 Tax=Paramecium tetraurelia TaxID=5888 RepID=A0C988_PARTE|nr:uncharacterized protein GSPATT00006661001 [Paramecium tetraurelia]CAK67355.1 unnamed protein product [Paramecium tetraurelia]|eukprot:XP_001434752.1 hypothetical protein (macronuclear) [Paramecium tetraurelia strain d4-2]
MNNNNIIPIQLLQQLRLPIRNKDYSTSLQSFNQFLGQAEQYIKLFNQQNLDQIKIVFGMILEDLDFLQLKPVIQIWRVNFTDLFLNTFNLSFAKALCQYYVSLSECSQIFKTPLFNEISKQICQIFCILCWDKDISDEIRHSKCLRSFIRMLRVNCTDDLLACLVIVTKNSKNSEYMTIKKSQDQLLQLFRNNINRELVQLIIANMCFNNDQRLLFWCQGILQVLKLTLDASSLTLIWKLLYDCPEVIDELLKYAEFFNHLYKQINTINEECALMIGIIRKICENNEQYKLQHIENIVNIFSNFIENNQMLSQKYEQQHPSIRQFIFKEIFSFFGIVGNQYIQPQIIPHIISLIYQNSSDNRLLTVGIGMLTNLSTYSQILNIIQNDKLFYQIILQILEQFHDKQQLIEYTLKLMINTLTNQIISIQYAQPRFIMKLFFIWHVSPENVSVNNLIIRVLRGLYVITNANAQILSQCINELQQRNNTFDFVDLCSLTINTNLQQNRLENVVEIYMLISIIPNLKLNSIKFQNTIKQYVEIMRAKGELKKALQAVSHLPIEDIGLQF